MKNFKVKNIRFIILLVAFSNVFSLNAQNSKAGDSVILSDTKTLFSVNENNYVSARNILPKEDAVSVVVFWQSTCAPCIREFKTINKKLSEWQKVYNFKIYAVSTDRVQNFPKAIAIWKENQWDIPLFIDKNNVLKKALLGDWHGVPQLFIIKEQKIIYHKLGYQQGDENIITTFLPKKR